MIVKLWKVVKEVAIGILLVLSLSLVVNGAIKEIGSSFSFWKFITEAIKLVPLLSLLIASAAFFFWRNRKFQEKRFEHIFLSFEKANLIYSRLRYTHHLHSKLKKILNKPSATVDEYERNLSTEILNTIKLEVDFLEKECFDFMGTISILDTIYKLRSLRDESDDIRDKFHNSIEGFARLFEDSESYNDFLVHLDLSDHPDFGFVALEEAFYQYRLFISTFIPEKSKSFMP